MTQSLPRPPAAPRRSRPWPWLIAGLVAAGVIAAALFQAWPLLHPQVVARAPLDPDCDLRAGPCQVAFAEGGEVGLAIEPRAIPVMRPLRLTVDLSGLDPLWVEVDFAGTDMNMGYNRVKLLPAGSGRFEGEAMLPVCVRERMTWEAQVLLQTPRGLLSAPFRFDTWRSGAPAG